MFNLILECLSDLLILKLISRCLQGINDHLQIGDWIVLGLSILIRQIKIIGLLHTHLFTLLSNILILNIIFVYFFNTID